MTAPTGGSAREPIPPGRVSTIRGRYQVPGLTWLARGLIALGIAGMLVDGTPRTVVGTVAVAVVVAAPLLRVAWLVVRWIQERDGRFVLAGVGLLAVVAAGVVLAALGVGS